MTLPTALLASPCSPGSHPELTVVPWGWVLCSPSSAVGGRSQNSLSRVFFFQWRKVGSRQKLFSEMLSPLLGTLLLLLEQSRQGQGKVWEGYLQASLFTCSQKPHSQGDPGPDPDRQLRWQPMGALAGRRRLDSTAEPAGVAGVRP